MRTHIDEMNQEIQIYRETPGEQSTAGFSPKADKEIIRTCWAKVRHSVSGSEDLSSNAQDVINGATFTIRTNPTNPDEVLPGMFVSHKGKEYRIIAAIPDDEERGRTVITTTRKEREEPWQA
ncbi:MAG: phage head closure protein [Lachnospiraceae bacterium]|nr:phage head closure protein [Lachnospiraceae bacterium]